MASPGPFAVCNVLLQLLSIGCGIAIVVIVSEQLWLSWSLTWEGVWHSGSDSGNICLMNTNSINMCAYAWVVAAVSWILSIILLAAQAMRNSRVCNCLAVSCAAFGLVWWIAAAIAATVYGVDADDANYPKEGYRTSVRALGWAEVGLFALTLLFSFCGRSKAEDKKKAEGAAGAQAQGTEGAPTGAYTSNPTYVTEGPPPAVTKV